MLIDIVAYSACFNLSQNVIKMQFHFGIDISQTYVNNQLKGSIEIRVGSGISFFDL